MPMLSTQVDIDAVCAWAESLCRTVAPLDLGDTPIYVVPQTRLPDDLGGKAVCDGYTSPHLDLYLQTVIGPAWRGRGACMVVNDTDFGDQMEAADIEANVSGVVLHELAHVLDRPAIYRDRQGDDPMRIQFEALCVGDAVSREPAPTATAAPFDGHDHKFIRTALHLRHRAERAGVLVSLYCYCAGTYYGLSHPIRYREALGNELARLADLSIRQILDIPYPSAFWRLWFDDVSHWLSCCSVTLERSFSQ